MIQVSFLFWRNGMHFPSFTHWSRETFCATLAFNLQRCIVRNKSKCAFFQKKISYLRSLSQLLFVWQHYYWLTIIWIFGTSAKAQCTDQYPIIIKQPEFLRTPTKWTRWLQKEPTVCAFIENIGYRISLSVLSDIFRKTYRNIRDYDAILTYIIRSMTCAKSWKITRKNCGTLWTKL